MKTIAKVTEETLRLQAYLEKQTVGSVLGYKDIERASGVKLDTAGRSYLRTALKRAKLEYSPVRGYGIKLACAEMVMPLLANRIVRIDRAVKRGDKTQRLLQEQFFASLSAEEQRSVLFAGAVFGAIRLAADNGKRLMRHKNAELLPASIAVPIPGVQ